MLGSVNDYVAMLDVCRRVRLASGAPWMAIQDALQSSALLRTVCLHADQLHPLVSYDQPWTEPVATPNDSPLEGCNVDEDSLGSDEGAGPDGVGLRHGLNASVLLPSCTDLSLYVR
jgi:hypothetical protein